MDAGAMQKSAAAVFLCLVLARILLQKLPPGLPRLLFVFLPSLPFFACFPLTVSIHCLRSFLAFCFLWVCPTKLFLLCCWDISIDDLTTPLPHLSLPHFLFYLFIPLRFKASTSPQVILKGSKPVNAVTSKESYPRPSIASFFLHLVGLLSIVNACMYLRNEISIWMYYALLCLEVYFGLQVYMGGLSLVALLGLGLESYPIHNSPFRSSSLSEFWGKRWNLVVSTMLRASVYDPILLFLSTQRSKKKQKTIGTSVHADARNGAPLSDRAIATLATFAVSGLVHEAIFCCMTQTKATWEVTGFFILHGFVTILEITLRKYFFPMIPFEFPRFLSVGMTLGFLYITICWLFLPPVCRSGFEFLTNSEFYEAQASMLSSISRVIR